SPLLRAWLRRLADLGVALHTRHRWIGWDEAGALRIVKPTGVETSVAPDVTIFALGGASWPRLGPDGGWVSPLRAAGVAVTPLEAANAGVEVAWSDIFRQRFEGQPIKRLAVTCEGETALGEAMVTRTGLEGGAIYAIGRQVRDQIARKGSARILIDVRPSFSVEELANKLAQPRNKQSTANFLRKVAGMAPIAISLAREGARGPLPNDAPALAALIKAIPLTVTGMSGLARAISTAGGVRFDVLDEGLMIKAMPGAFVVGEMLDWEAPTGGYLLQATFATAVRAAEGAQTWLDRDQTK
ncbi:MAG: TIGR03862 family flavoprotein, partial [Hyphomicrobiaceae bacterium]